MATVLAAGTLPWRRRRGRLQVALVHRPRYDDWSWAKGKLDRGETFPAAATRETLEEAGLRVRLGHPLPTTTYTVAGNGHPTAKEVRYWAAEVVGGDGELVHEVDEVAWLETDAATARLTYAHDRAQIEALVAAETRGRLSTWPLALVRHAKACPRSSWTAEDALRPLDDRGRDQAAGLVPLLDAYGITRLVTSPSARARDTLAPFARHGGARLRLKPGLSEEGHEQDPARAGRHLQRLLERGAPAALCSHGTVLPALVAQLRERLDPDLEGAARRGPEDLLTGDLAKGETVLAHLIGTGDDARVVAVERYDPRDPV
ncbi:NUDIX hydrolase [Janibacter sp. GS2]|uniref:NUDIX hydrolase n=1 Tax=Janibacter sp. GS2 TaxID=3442646 RepID=UPI003EB8B548